MKRNWISGCGVLVRKFLIGFVIVLMAAGCTTEGRVRYVDGGYRKIYPDARGGYYYVNRHAEKVHLDHMPPDDDPEESVMRDLR